MPRSSTHTLDLGPSRSVRRTSLALVTAVLATMVATFLSPAPASAVPVTAPTLVQASAQVASTSDTTDTDQNIAHADHDTAANATTVVSTFSVGQPADGLGSPAIGFATSTDNGRTWSNGLLSGLTDSPEAPGGAYPRVVDSSVAWDAKNAKWIIPSVTYVATGNPPPAPGFLERALFVNTSTNATGLTWNTAARINPPDDTISADKPWVGCDNFPASPNYGHCYIAFTQRNVPVANGFTSAVVTSTDGGTTWSAPVTVANPGTTDLVDAYNLYPVIQPSGKLVVIGTEVNGDNGAGLFSFNSTDGGASFSVPALITTIQRNDPPTTAGSIRQLNKPVADVDAAGKITVVWSDCRFSSVCTSSTGANQLVAASSTDGSTFSAPSKLNIPGATATNQFGQGFAIAPGTSGVTAQLSVVYDTLTPCSVGNCVDVKYATSYDGGTTWSAPYAINVAPIPRANISDNPRGNDLGDYNSLSFVEGAAIAVLPLAPTAPTSTTDFSQASYGFAAPVNFLKPVVTAPAPAPVAPNTTITKHPKKKLATTKNKVKVKFKFASTVAGSTFECKIDKKKWKSCNSGKFKTKVRANHKHKFKVRATAAGLTDATPAKFKFKVRLK